MTCIGAVWVNGPGRCKLDVSNTINLGNVWRARELQAINYLYICVMHCMCSPWFVLGYTNIDVF